MENLAADVFHQSHLILFACFAGEKFKEGQEDPPKDEDGQDEGHVMTSSSDAHRLTSCPNYVCRHRVVNRVHL